MNEIHHSGFSGAQDGTVRTSRSGVLGWERPPETPTERWQREHLNQHLQLVTRREWLEGQRRDRRWETFLIVTGAIFDALVVVLAVERFIF